MSGFLGLMDCIGDFNAACGRLHEKLSARPDPVAAEVDRIRAEQRQRVAELRQQAALHDRGTTALLKSIDALPDAPPARRPSRLCPRCGAAAHLVPAKPGEPDTGLRGNPAYWACAGDEECGWVEELAELDEMDRTT